MHRSLIGTNLVLLTCGIAMAQTRDPRVDDLTKETAQLKRTIADQERRIAELERTVKVLQGAMTPATARILSDTPAWHVASNWGLIRKGMSEAQVMEILGPPTRVQSAIDTRTMLYMTDARSSTTLSGSVTLTDDRVTASTPPNIRATDGSPGAPSSRIPADTPQWQVASNWSLIRSGMSEAQVEEILGPPTRVQAAIDTRTLIYTTDGRSARALNGSVTLTDDRVTTMGLPKF
jgi:outer membrane protein assembly factor BamE (lipoprotein component of BamABCDE complex)